jgi:hypothetical protein
MKKIILNTILILVCSLSTKAQYYVGASLSFNSSSTSSESEIIKISSNSFSINPEIGYCLAKKLDIGISVSFDQRPSMRHEWMPNLISDNFDERTEKTRTQITQIFKFGLFLK